jgi:hypothetical protein
LAAAALLGACLGPRRPFPVGLGGPVPARVAEEASRLGLIVEEAPPDGAAYEDAADGSSTASRDSLRFTAARAVARGATGLYFRLPATPVGTDLLSYPEEWQAFARVARELLSVKPILERGAPSQAPMSVPAGVDSRAWRFHGRRYVLLVNVSDKPAPLEQSDLVPWRALFTVRADPRESLIPCGRERCLPARGVLWLEGRLL